VAERRDIDGVAKFLGLRWEAPNVVLLEIRPEHINAAGILSGAVTYGLVDYCMGSTLWTARNEGEAISTINIAINYLRTATEGEIVCTTELDRRNDRIAVLRSEVRTVAGKLLATAIGSYSIFPERRIEKRRRIDAGASGSAD
jgi:uncharacterized protein (TIGR00369 family)